MSDMRLFKHAKWGTWYIEFERGHSISLKTKDKTIAEAILQERIEEVKNEKVHELHNSITFARFKKECLSHIKATKSPAYATSIQYSLDHFADFIGDKQLAKLTKRDMARFVEHRLNQKTTEASKARGKGYSKSSVNIDIRNLKAALGIALEWEYIHKNPFAGYKQLKIDKKAPAYLSPIEITQVLKKIEDPVIKRAFMFYILTGCRREEIVTLTWRHIDLNNNRIHIEKTKTHLDRYVPISDKLRTVIDTIPHRVGYLFPGKIKGKHLHTSTMSKKIKQCLVAGGFGRS